MYEIRNYNNLVFLGMCAMEEGKKKHKKEIVACAILPF